MISLPRITRLAGAHRFDTLLDAILANGRHVPLPIRMRLADPAEALPAAALALALQRFLELTLAPTPQATDLARALLDRQRPGGGFGSVPATAAALAALTTLRDHLSGWNGAPEPCSDLTHRLAPAIDDALAFLRDARDNAPATLDASPLLADELDTLIALWQLAEHPDLAAELDLPAVLTTLHDLGLAHDRTLAPILHRAETALTSTAPHTPTLAA